MSRIIKDIKDKNTGLLVYPKTHIKAVVVDEGTTLEQLIGSNVDDRLNKLESVIITDGEGNLYLTDDGTYKDLNEYQKIVDADAKYSTITTVNGINTRLEEVEATYINKSTAATKEELATKQDIIEDLEVIRAGAAKGATSLQEHQDISHLATKSELNTELAKKVDIVEGKQLSTEDFTSALKAKLDSLNNYDDTAINEAIEGIQTQIDTLVNADATTAINTFNEIIAFLEGIENSEDLDSIIAAIELQIADINTNLANYLLKTDAENTYLSKSEASMTYQPVGNYITSIPEEYITESELIAKNYVDSDTMTTELAKKLNVIDDLEEIRSLSNSALQAIPSEYITEEELNNKIQVVETTPAELPTDSIVFIQDSKLLSVNGIVYKTVNWSVLEPSLYKWVDLGLLSGTQWAAWNVGATKPEEFGLYFAWGETEGYEGITDEKQFIWDDYKLCGGSNSTLTKYNNNSSYGTVDNLTILELSDDAAYQNDNTCRMPTKADFEELKANTTSTWETLNGVNGMRFTSNTNGNSIFVPAAGYCGDGSVNRVGLFGCLWSSSLDESSPNISWYWVFNSEIADVSVDRRSDGLTVRPVKSNN